MRLCTSQHYTHLWSPACFSVHCSFALGTLYNWNLFSVKRTGAGTVKLHWKTVGNCVRVTRNKYLLEYVLVVQRGWKGLFLLCPLIPSPKCIISRIECTDDLLTLFGILKALEPICQELFGIESALIPFLLAKILNPSPIPFFLFLFLKAFLYIAKPKHTAFAQKSNNNWKRPLIFLEVF